MSDSCRMPVERSSDLLTAAEKFHDRTIKTELSLMHRTPLLRKSGTKHRTGAFVSYCTKSLTLLLALSIVGLPLAHGAKLRSNPRTKVIQVRLIASEPSLPTTSFGLNWTSYVAELQFGKEPPQLVRFMYRNYLSAPTLPKSFLDYSLVHRFRALRDEQCDLPLTTMLYSYRFTSGTYDPARPIGRELTLEYASLAPKFSEQDSEQDHQLLPCYVVRAKDYKGSHATKPVVGHPQKSDDGY